MPFGDAAMTTSHPKQEERTARLFRNGRNQAVRLPVEFEIDADEVTVRREGNQIVLIPRPRSWMSYFSTARTLSEDFPDHIDDQLPQQREPL
jgi:antitoxin VapB